MVALGGQLRRQSEHHYIQREVATWVAQATSAMHEVLPPGHALIQRWDACLKDQVGEKTAYLTYDGLVDTLRGTFSAAYDMLSKGRLSSFVGCIRAETVGDLLHQADNLAEQKFAVAATVFAGGALATFLHFVCDRNNLTWQGHGSIELGGTPTSRMSDEDWPGCPDCGKRMSFYGQLDSIGEGTPEAMRLIPRGRAGFRFTQAVHSDRRCPPPPAEAG